jgi:hypothetical protein
MKYMHLQVAFRYLCALPDLSERYGAAAVVVQEENEHLVGRYVEFFPLARRAEEYLHGEQGM